MALKAKIPKKSGSAHPAKQAALNEAAREEVTRISALIPTALHRKVKIQAVEEGRTFTDILIQSLLEYMQRNK